MFLAFHRSLPRPPLHTPDMEQLALMAPTNWVLSDDDGDEGVHTFLCVCARGESSSYLSRLIPPPPPSLSLSLALLTLKHTHKQTHMLTHRRKQKQFTNISTY